MGPPRAHFRELKRGPGGLSSAARPVSRPQELACAPRRLCGLPRKASRPLLLQGPPSKPALAPAFLRRVLGRRPPHRPVPGRKSAEALRGAPAAAARPGPARSSSRGRGAEARTGTRSRPLGGPPSPYIPVRGPGAAVGSGLESLSSTKWQGTVENQVLPGACQSPVVSGELRGRGDRLSRAESNRSRTNPNAAAWGHGKAVRASAHGAGARAGSPPPQRFFGPPRARGCGARAGKSAAERGSRTTWRRGWGAAGRRPRSSPVGRLLRTY